MFDMIRIQRLQAALCDAGAGAMHIRDTASIEWLTGFAGVFDEEEAHALFVPARGDEVWLHTDSRYELAAKREAASTPVVVDVEAKGFAAWALERSSHDGLAERPLAIETSIPLAEYRALEQAFGSADAFVETEGLIMGLRAIKDAREVERLAAAQAVTDAAFASIVDYIEPGMTERDIQLELDRLMLTGGADGLAFPSIVASGPNGASPHAIVSERRIQQGDCIVMDFGARKDGYCSDMTRTVFVGRPEGQMLEAWEVLRRANEAVEGALRPGMTGKEAHELALRVLDEGGFGGLMGHGLGHGVGIQVHEAPVLSPRNGSALVPGNVVTVEPGIYVPDRFGMRLEDFGVVTEDGSQVLTRTTHEMIVV